VCVHFKRVGGQAVCLQAPSARARADPTPSTLARRWAARVHTAYEGPQQNFTGVPPFSLQENRVGVQSEPGCCSSPFYLPTLVYNKRRSHDTIRAIGEARATASSEAVARTTRAVTLLPLRRPPRPTPHPDIPTTEKRILQKLPRTTLGTGLARTGTNTGTPREPPRSDSREDGEALSSVHSTTLAAQPGKLIHNLLCDGRVKND